MRTLFMYWHDGSYWRWVWLERLHDHVVRAAWICLLLVGLVAVAWALAEAGSA